MHFNEIMSLPSEERCYCHTCYKLICKTETITTEKHKGHDIKESLTDYEMQHPTEILKPLEDSKQEAQYFFTKKATEDITNMLVKLGAKQVLCIGTPKIHEYIIDKYEDKISSLLLDFDGRFVSFFCNVKSELNYIGVSKLLTWIIQNQYTFLFCYYITAQLLWATNLLLV